MTDQIKLYCHSNQRQSNWDAVTTHRAWRHTVGRISCLARLPIYALGVFGQGIKTVIKAFVSPVVSFGRWATGSKKLESWSFTGVAKDAIMMGSLVDTIGNSALCVLCAPPKQYFSFYGALKKAVYIVVLGRYHGAGKDERAHSVGQVFFKAVQGRAQYHKQIVQCDCIYSSKLNESVRIDGEETFLSNESKKQIKAG